MLKPILPLFALILLTACGSDVVGPTDTPPTGSPSISISGARIASFKGLAQLQSTVANGVAYQELMLSSPDGGMHMIGVFRYKGEFATGTVAIGDFDTSIETANVVGTYAYTTTSISESYGSISGSATVTESTTSYLKGTLSFTAREADDTSKIVTVEADFIAPRQ